MPTNTYIALDKVTVGTATPSITFSSIPATYTDLVVVMSPATTHTLATFPYMRFNGDSGSNYSYTEMNGTGSSALSARDTNQTIAWTSPQMGSISNTLGDNTTIVNIMNYSNSTTNKTYLSRANRAGSTLDYQGVEAAVGLWRNTAAITSVLIGNRRGGVDYNFAVGSTFSLYGIAADTNAFTAKATGGTITADVGYIYHTFTSSGTFTPLQSLSVDALVIAGGGGAGDFAQSGGGGAGGLVYLSSQTLSSATTITVGAGGAAGGGGYGTQASNGTNSSITGFTAAVGGGGAGTYDGTSGRSGGSGGGEGGRGGNASGGGAGTSGQGFAGGSGTTSNNEGGGGGGAGAVGNTGGQAKGGNGLSTYSTWGLATSTGQNVSGTRWYAGGGGGYGFGTSGGLGGGGGLNTPGVLPGTANTGGGGGAWYSNGGAGGSGLIIVRYAK